MVLKSKEIVLTNGIKIKAPERECHDKNCPFHGSLRIRGQSFVGKVISKKSAKTVIVLLDRLFYIKKYQRYEHRNSKFAVHLPDCIDVQVGDFVRFFETRPISKTKHFVVVENLKLNNIVNKNINTTD